MHMYVRMYCVLQYVATYVHAHACIRTSSVHFYKAYSSSINYVLCLGQADKFVHIMEFSGKIFVAPQKL